MEVYAYVSLISGSDDDASATNKICGALASVDGVTGLVFSTTSGSGRWVMPDCFYEYPKLETIVVYLMIFKGNSTFPDPLHRIGKSITSLTRLSLYTGSFQYSNGDPYIANWDLALPALPRLKFLTFMRMQLRGQLPETLAAPLFSFTVDYNNLSGPFPERLFSSLPSSVSSLDFSANNNPISGTLPSPFFGNATFPNLVSAFIAITGQSITGSIPLVFPSSAPKLRSLSFYANSNKGLNGTIPPRLISDILDTPAHPLGTSVVLGFAACSIEGKLELPEATRPIGTYASLMLYFQTNDLTEVTFGVESARYISGMELEQNYRMVGQLSPLLTSNSSRLSFFYAYETQINGDMPDLAALVVGRTLSTLHLRSTNVQFCTPPGRAVWASTSLTSCNLEQTTAFYCQSLYPRCRTNVMPAPALAPVPVPFAPAPVPVPFAAPVPVFVPLTAPIPVSTPFAAPIAPSPVTIPQAIPSSAPAPISVPVVIPPTSTPSMVPPVSVPAVAPVSAPAPVPTASTPFVPPVSIPAVGVPPTSTPAPSSVPVVFYPVSVPTAVPVPAVSPPEFAPIFAPASAPALEPPVPVPVASPTTSVPSTPFDAPEDMQSPTPASYVPEDGPTPTSDIPVPEDIQSPTPTYDGPDAPQSPLALQPGEEPLASPSAQLDPETPTNGPESNDPTNASAPMRMGWLMDLASAIFFLLTVWY